MGRGHLWAGLERKSDAVESLKLIGKFLIDECLSVGLVAVAKARGHHADHVAHLGKSGWQDWNLVPFALANDYVLVTNNRADFLTRYAKLDVHNGLIIIIPNLKRADQNRLFDRALDVVSELTEAWSTRSSRYLLTAACMFANGRAATTIQATSQIPTGTERAIHNPK